MTCLSTHVLRHPLQRRRHSRPVIGRRTRRSQALPHLCAPVIRVSTSCEIVHELDGESRSRQQSVRMWRLPCNDFSSWSIEVRRGLRPLLVSCPCSGVHCKPVRSIEIAHVQSRQHWAYPCGWHRTRQLPDSATSSCSDIWSTCPP